MTAPALGTTTSAPRDRLHVAPAAEPLSTLEATRLAFAGSVAAGLDAVPRRLECRWLYDAAGSALFERITTLPEYYLTRVEHGLLAAHAARLRAVAGAQTLIELGCGSATKTRHLLRAWSAAGATRYVAVDVSATALDGACAEIARQFPHVRVSGLLETWDRALARIPGYGPSCLVLLGSSLGNLDETAADGFFARVAAALPAGSHFLVGVDLAKDAARLEPAYDDRSGVTAAFTRNLFARMNRELGTAIPLDAVEHVAHWNDRTACIEIHARFTRAIEIDLPDLGRRFRIAAGENVLVEISRKFDVEALVGAAAPHGLRLVEHVEDERWRYGLLLFRRTVQTPSPPPWRATEQMLAAVRARTLALLAPLPDDALHRAPSAVLGPIAWDLGHIADFEARWVSATYPAARTATLSNDRFYDPLHHPRTVRSGLRLPDRATLLDTLATTRARTRFALAHDEDLPSDPLRADAHLMALLAQHEAQHMETVLQAVQSMRYGYEPLEREAPPIARVHARPETRLVPAGTFTMGTDDRRVAYDNERPAHHVRLDAFHIDVHPITSAQFLAFMEDGGYTRRECWTAAGWAWLRNAGVSHPAHWRPAEAGAWDEMLFGRRTPLVPNRPVMHVCWYEADAYARWAGRRLPTEAEWEKAAAWDPENPDGRTYPWGDAPPTPARANLDARTFAPSPVGAHPDGRSWIGCEQMLGSVWEWTASDFAPYPGFVAFPYPEYSAVHFGHGYKVLRGGSWATQPVAIRNTFRNWDLPERRQLFAGFRCVDDA